MTRGEFLEELEAITQAQPGTIAVSDELSTLAGWDSMATVMFIALADEKSGVVVQPEAIERCITVGDLEGLLGIRS